MVSLLLDCCRAHPLREEDRRKTRETLAMLHVLQPHLRRGATVVDAACGKGYVGLSIAQYLTPSQIIFIEQNPTYAALCTSACTHVQRASVHTEVRVGAVETAALWPSSPDVVVALHACGSASDAVLSQSIEQQARWIFLVPCCYAESVAFAAVARARAEALGAAKHPAIRRKLVEGLIDTERTLRLEAAGYECTVLPFVAPTISPHNLLWRARRIGASKRSESAQEALTRLREG